MKNGRRKKTNIIRDDIQRQSWQGVVAYWPEFCFYEINAEKSDVFQACSRRYKRHILAGKSINDVQTMYQKHRNHETSRAYTDDLHGRSFC